MEAFLEALADHFRREGPKVIAKVAKEQLAAYLKICALLVPKELKVENSGGVETMTDEQLDAALEALRELPGEARWRAADVIEGTAEPVTLPAPGAQCEPTPAPKPPRKPLRIENRLSLTGR